MAAMSTTTMIMKNHNRSSSSLKHVQIKNCCFDNKKLVEEFNPKIPIEKAVTPPSSWYTHPSFLSLELDRVFHRGWLPVGYTEQINEPRDFFTGRVGQVEFVVCRDDDGKIHALHNVCHHHASLLASGSVKKSCFVCPYHGWTYGLNGALLKATRVAGIQDFDVNEFGLVTLKVATWGPFVLLNMDKEITEGQEVDCDTVAKEWLGSCSEIFSLNGVASSLSFICRLEYMIECNWKVFCDNYLDSVTMCLMRIKALNLVLSLILIPPQMTQLS